MHTDISGNISPYALTFLGILAMRTDNVGEISPCPLTFLGKSAHMHRHFLAILAHAHRHFWEISPCAHNTWAVWDKISHFSSILLFGKNKNYLKPPGKELKKITFILRQFCKKKEENFREPLHFTYKISSYKSLCYHFYLCRRVKLNITVQYHHTECLTSKPQGIYRENMTDKFFSVSPEPAIYFLRNIHQNRSIPLSNKWNSVLCAYSNKVQIWETL